MVSTIRTVLTIATLMVLTPLAVWSVDPPPVVERWWPGPPNAVVAYSTVAVLGTGTELRVIATTDPSDPVELASINLWGVVRGLALTGSAVLTAASDDGLYVIDITEPSCPTILSHIALARCQDVAVNGSVAYVIAHNCLHIMDVSDPAHPAPLGEIAQSGAERVVVKEGIAYVARAQDGLGIVSVADPSQPMGMSRTPWKSDGGGHILGDL
jgi:hypothetical protein